MTNRPGSRNDATQLPLVARGMSIYLRASVEHTEAIWVAALIYVGIIARSTIGMFASCWGTHS
jgi:hypothetical protein